MSEQSATEEQKSTKRFMALGDLQITQNTQNLTSSFVVTKEKKAFPDIYTTCPELRKFKLPLVFSNDSSKTEAKSKPEKTELKSTKAPRKPENYRQSVQNPQVHQHYNMQIPVRPFIFQRYPYQIVQIPLFQIFDPNSPIIRPYVF